MMRRAVWTGITLLALGLQAGASGERPVTQQEQTALAVTVYNDDLALIKDQRRVRLADGENRLAWRDVSARMQPETALIRAADGGRLRLVEQNFDFDLLTPLALLKKSVGETVRVIRPAHPATGLEATETAVVLAANDGVVLKFADRVETGIPGRLAFSSIPASLRERPTLTLLLRHEGSAERLLELTYLSGGLSWRADYVAELAPREEAIDLAGWVTLTNTSGTAYPNALLQLVAGDVQRARPQPKATPMMARAMVMEAEPQMQQEALFEYHLYTLERPVTLLDQQTKQVALLTAPQVPVQKEYVLHGAEHYYHAQHGDLGRRLKPAVYLEFVNQGGVLGVPLPKGVVRVYKKDAAGRAQFIGEDAIEHTARGEKVRLRLGQAFDLTADKRQTDFQRIAGPMGRGGVHESAYELIVRNAKREPVVLKVIEPMPGDWQMVAESQPHRKETAHTAVWLLKVPAEGEARLTWRVRVRY
ncbi:MAG: DUF4139 domain-containing protein [Thiobacillaceae bacterium]|nr:DUF4139 domain-containing protein [Thiobacillaceae bacterium]